MKYEVVIGLEVHVELSTRSKLFCSCSASFGNEPNENVCPACAGAPGVPPVLNKRAVELGIAAALLTNSVVSKNMTFDKKNYFYPDLPSGYQVTQWNAPICRDGWVEIETSGGKKKITLKQIHIEEDAGKLVHEARSTKSLVDFNRTSVPLIEIVSNPDFRSAEEAVAYLEKLRSLLSFAGVSDCKMQEGSMRCDVNISVREAGAATLGARSEIKNMNSLKAIAAAIRYESARHIEILEDGAGGTLVQETRRWDDDAGETFSMREKEDAADYRYFPHPEIMPVEISEEWIERVRESLPETADAKYARLTGELGISAQDARIITNSRALSDIFDGAARLLDKPRDIASWIVVDLLALAKGDNKGGDDARVDCAKFAKIISMTSEGAINRAAGKKVLQKVLEDGVDPEEYVKANNLGMAVAEDRLTQAVGDALAANGKSVADYRAGNQKALGFLIGQVMRGLGGKGDPKSVGAALEERLSADPPADPSARHTPAGSDI